MDDKAYGTNLEVPYMDEEPSAKTGISSGELAVPRGTENLIDEIEEFIPGVRRYYKKICANDLQEHQKNEFRQLLPLWNTFLQLNQATRYTALVYPTGYATFVSVLVNWPDVKQYGGLCLLEWNLGKSPTNNAHLIPECSRRSLAVACLKFTKGVCEACPQAILQLCLLVPDLYGDWTWTDYLRIAAALVSLCTAGVALVNREKYERIKKVPTSELYGVFSGYCAKTS